MPTTTERQYGAELRRLRKAAGMSQRDLAHLLKVGVPHVSKVENGRERPSIWFIIDAHRIFGGDLKVAIKLAGRCGHCGGWPELGAG